MIFVGSFIIRVFRETYPAEVRSPEITYDLEFNLKNDKSYSVKKIIKSTYRPT
jgi:hypothetical protein